MSCAVIRVAPAITWLLVITSPLEVTTIPVPAARPLPVTVLMSTSPGSMREAAASVAADGAPAELPPPLCDGTSLRKSPPNGTPLPLCADAEGTDDEPLGQAR